MGVLREDKGVMLARGGVVGSISGEKGAFKE